MARYTKITIRKTGFEVKIVCVMLVNFLNRKSFPHLLDYRILTFRDWYIREHILGMCPLMHMVLTMVLANGLANGFNWVILHVFLNYLLPYLLLPLLQQFLKEKKEKAVLSLRDLYLAMYFPLVFFLFVASNLRIIGVFFFKIILARWVGF